MSSADQILQIIYKKIDLFLTLFMEKAAGKRNLLRN